MELILAKHHCAYTCCSSLVTDVTGFVAVDPINKLVVVSFRGSHSLRNFITDFNYKLVSSDLCDGCTAHQGFWQSWTEARSDVLNSTKSAMDSNPAYNMVVTGHSLGGAIATLAAAELRNSGYPVALVLLPLFAKPFTSLIQSSIHMALHESAILHWRSMFPTSREATIVSLIATIRCLTFL